MTIAVAVAGCGPATAPHPTASSAPAAAESSPPGRAAPTPSGLPDHDALRLEIHAIDPAETAGVLEFASDGQSILFSSGQVDGPHADTAPDLYRHVPGDPHVDLVWSNPDRNSTIVKIAGDLGTWAFVDMTHEGDPSWNLRVVARGSDHPTFLASYDATPGVPTLVPSLAVNQEHVIWTEFASRDGRAVSRLMRASGPDWTPAVVEEWPADDAEVWLPSLRGSLLAYTVVSAPGTDDEAHEVHLRDLANADIAPIRLDVTGRATMPLVVAGGVIWKETEPGFSMFNWGTLVRHDLDTGRTAPVTMGGQEHVNYPSMGSRFVAAWGSDASTFTVHDTEHNESRTIARYTAASGENVMRPNVSGDLLVWMHVTMDGVNEARPAELRYAFLPAAGSDRD